MHRPTVSGAFSSAAAALSSCDRWPPSSPAHAVRVSHRVSHRAPPPRAGGEPPQRDSRFTNDRMLRYLMRYQVPVPVPELLKVLDLDLVTVLVPRQLCRILPGTPGTIVASRL
jgi:hypothetical protein